MFMWCNICKKGTNFHYIPEILLGKYDSRYAHRWKCDICGDVK
jgi:hypothetical protein